MGHPAAKLILLAALAAAAQAETLAGKVVEDHTGNPLASVEVKIFRTGSRFLAADLETGTDGKFEAPGLPPGEYRIEASKSNYVTSTVRPRSAHANLLVRLVRCGAITGQVMDGQGQPVIGASVYAMPKPADGSPFHPQVQIGQGNYDQVNEHGQFRLFNLPPGDYAVAVTWGASTTTVGSTGSARVRPGIGSGVQVYPTTTRPQFFSISGGEEYANVDFSIAPGALFNVRGKVEAEPGTYWVALAPLDAPALAVAVAQTERNGNFELLMVPPGSYQITAAGPSGARSGFGGMLGDKAIFGRSHVDVGADVEGVSITPVKGVSGQVMLRVEKAEGQGGNGCPASAQIGVKPLEDWASYLDKNVQATAAQPATIENLAPARYRVMASKLGESCYQSGEAILDLRGGSSAQPVAVLVAPAGSIRGKLTGDDAADATVALVSADPAAAGPSVQLAMPDADGKFTFGGLRPGRYKLAAQPAGAGGVAARWVAGTGMLEVQVAAGVPTTVELPVKHPQ